MKYDVLFRTVAKPIDLYLLKYISRKRRYRKTKR